jgi:OmpA-OmpF porin, OOP family
MRFIAVKRKSSILFSAGLMVLSANALAEEESLSPVADVTPQFIAILPFHLTADDDRGASEGRGFRAIYGRSLAEHWYWESDFFGAVMETGASSATDFYQLGVGTGLSWSLYERSHTQWTPYAIGTLGAVFNDVQPDSDDGGSFVLAAGLGAVSKSLFDNGLKLRGEVRYLFDTFDKDFGDLHWSLGLEIPLGQVKTVERIVYVDRTVEVEVEKVIQVSDHDTDGDSVPDSRDKCENTLSGARVDATGCIIDAQTVTFNTISFQSRSSELTYGSKKTLLPVAESFKSQKDLKIEIAGHTDSIGSAEYNHGLSQERADAVRQFFIDQGVESSRLTAVGYGEMEPVTENDTESGRAMNRRVEFRLLK